MSPALKLTDEEKQNGKRNLLTPLKEIQELMQLVTYDRFTQLVKCVIPPSEQPDQATN